MTIVNIEFDEFLEERTQWNQAAERSIDNNIFLSWEWISTWWKHFGEKRRFFLIAITDRNNILAAAPLMLSTHSILGLTLTKLQFVGSPDSDYHSFLLTQGNQQLAMNMIKYAHRRVPELDIIELREIPETSETAKLLGNAPNMPCRFERRSRSTCPCVHLPGNYEEYFAGLSSNLRASLRASERKLMKNFKVAFRIVGDPDATEKAMRTMFELHEKRRAAQKQDSAFMRQKTRDFHLEVAKTFADRGWLVLAFLTLDEEPVAALYAFKYANKLHYYQSGFDPRYYRYGVLQLLHNYLIRHCIANGLSEYDFMRGNEPYKRRWNAVERTNLEFRAVKRRPLPLLLKWVPGSSTIAAKLSRM